MRTKEIKDYIRAREHLFWYSPEDKTETVTDELLVETILNYGNLNDVRELFNVFGKQNVADIFFRVTTRSERSKNNYNELTRNFFTLYFDKYAHRNII